ncbi:MAG: alpha/beta hydrolase [Candidatus Promineifilaceae bacterium]
MNYKPKGNYAPVNGLNMYYEVHGTGEPLILLHGGLGSSSTMFGENLPLLAKSQQVFAVDLQAHGHTADIDRPMRFEVLADDIAAFIYHLGLDKANVLGYSLGGSTALRLGIQHPNLVHKLVLVSVPTRRTGWFPEVLAGMAGLNGAAAEMMKPSPVYQEYIRIAPNPDGFPKLLDKMGDLMSQDYDWTQEAAALEMPVLLVYGDADSIPTTHIAEFYGLLGGGKADAGWDGSNMPKSRLAVLPGTTHYNIAQNPALAAAVLPFLNTPENN